LDERGKKKWELLICDEDRQFEFSRFFSNNQINSTQVPLMLPSPHHIGPMHCQKLALNSAIVIKGRVAV
jgi:RNA-binding protein Tab2/Atab2